MTLDMELIQRLTGITTLPAEQAALFERLSAQLVAGEPLDADRLAALLAAICHGLALLARAQGSLDAAYAAGLRDGKRRRAEGIQRMLARLREEWGRAPDAPLSAHVSYGGGTEDCYCACAEGGPCQHEWTGWRDFEDGSGGEAVCGRCGMGAMQHSLATCWE